MVTLDGKPVHGAKVYLDIAIAGASQYGENTDLITTFTNEEGKYVLRGVPPDSYAIDVVATYDASYTVIGDTKRANIVNNKATNVNLALKSYSDIYINNLYGFPLSVEKLDTSGTKGTVKVTGIVNIGAGFGDFSLNESYKLVRVENITFKGVPYSGHVRPGAEELYPSVVGVALDNKVTLKGTTKLNLWMFLPNLRNYKLLLEAASATPPQSGKSSIPLSIERNNEGVGSISGTLKIVDNSFNYTQSYFNFDESEFYLATMYYENVNNSIKAIIGPLSEMIANELPPNTASPSLQRVTSDLPFVTSGIAATLNKEYLDLIESHYVPLPDTRYHLTNASGNGISFQLLDFDATAKPESSYIDEQGRIHLSADIKCHIPHGQPEEFSVSIPEVILDNNNVYPTQGKNRIEVNLGKTGGWKLVAEDWVLDPKEGGILSNKAWVSTKIIDIPLEKFVLRKDGIYFPTELPKGFKLSMGGGATYVSLDESSNPKPKPVLQWDNKVGADMQGHWRFSINAPGNGRIAYTDNLADLTDTQGKATGFDIYYLQILDNNEMIFQLKQKDYTISGVKQAKFRPQALDNNPDFLKIKGTLNIGAPRVGDLPFELYYTKSGVAKTNQVQVDFAGKGNVRFQASSDGENITFVKNKEVRIFGKVFEDKGGNTFNPMPATLIAGDSGYSIDIPVGWVTSLTNDEKDVYKQQNGFPKLSDNKIPTKGFSLTIKEGGMKVANGDWSLLTYSGDMTDHDNTEGGLEKPEMNFTVLGDVKADANSVQITGMDTPFGQFTSVFDFNKKRLTGTLTAKGIALPPVRIRNGVIEFVADPKGFCISGSADVDLDVPVIAGNYQLGFMLGYYRDNDYLVNTGWEIVNKFKDPLVRSDCYRDYVLKPKGLAGFYFTLDRKIFDLDFGYNFAVIWGKVWGKGIIGADIFANFTPNASAGLIARFKLNAGASLNAVTGTSISGSLDAGAALEFVYNNSKLNANGTLDMTLGVKVKQWFPVVGKVTLFDEEVGCHASAGTSGFQFGINHGNPHNGACISFK
jgi:hypothetical protein